MMRPSVSSCVVAPTVEPSSVSSFGVSAATCAATASFATTVVFPAPDGPTTASVATRGGSTESATSMSAASRASMVSTPESSVTDASSATSPSRSRTLSTASSPRQIRRSYSGASADGRVRAPLVRMMR